MKRKRKGGLKKAVTSFIILAIIVVAVSVYYVTNDGLIGPAFVALGFLSLGFLKFFHISLESVYPDVLFGLIDNGILVFAAVIGGVYAGVAGAIIGGAAGNTITDGIGGLFEGHIAEKQRNSKIENSRTPLSTMLGKVVGCLFGAGIGLILVFFFRVLI